MDLFDDKTQLTGTERTTEAAYTACTLCPRRCGINRTEGKTGFCKETAELKSPSPAFTSEKSLP